MKQGLPKESGTDFTASAFGWLTGNEIRRQVALSRITISPFDAALLNPNSYNYRLSPSIQRLTNDVIDMKSPDDFEEIVIPQGGLVLQPSECYIGCTVERFGSDFFAALITGRSSVGRKFITNHITAGLIDQGFYGNITLELVVHRPTRVYPGIVFGQIFWFTPVGEVALYRGKYAGQAGPTGSRLHFETEEHV